MDRLRRRVVFERLLARLFVGQPGRWILKGGMALEFRLGDRARATRDLDLVVRGIESGREAVVEALSSALVEDPHGDGFEYDIAGVRELSLDEAGRSGWRFSVIGKLASRTFARVRVDVVARGDEITGTELITPTSVIDVLDLPPLTIEVVNRAQHFAEKIHALTRRYGDLASTRPRDLADLMILLDDGLEADSRLADAIDTLFASRGTHKVPRRLPDPPASWDREFASTAGDLELDQRSVIEAMERLHGFWERIARDHWEE